MKRIAFIGLGVMGAEIAGRLSMNHHSVVVYNRTPSKVDHWLQRFNGDSGASVQTAALGCDVVITCVADDKALREIYLDEQGLLSILTPQTLCIDHSSVSAEISKELATKIKQRGSAFIDAPVSGGVQGAKLGNLSIMCGGEPTQINRAEAIMQAYAGKISHVGPAGSGQLCKMANQICVSATLQGVAEALYFAQASGLELNSVIRAISGGAAGSWQLEHRGPQMVNGEYSGGFSSNLMLKDMVLALTQADLEGISLPLSKEVAERYKMLIEQKHGTEDIAKLFELLRVS